MTQSVRYYMQRKSKPERYQSDNMSVVAHVQGLLWHSIIAYVLLKGLKNDHDCAMTRGPYLSRGDQGYRTPENCSYS